MKRVFQLIFAFLLALGAVMMALDSCTPQPAQRESAPTEPPQSEETAAPPVPVETAAPVEEATVEESSPLETASPAETPAAKSMAEMTPSERAAAWGLPEPPAGVDLSAREFKLANSYNSITDQRPNHSYGAGVIVDAVSDEAFNSFVGDCIAAGYGVNAFRGYLDYWTVLENYYEPEVYAHGAYYAASVTHVPGCNDHQTALCVDLRLGAGDAGIDFRGTEAWDWLISHCADYGIILRYPEGQESWYGHACMNPCHFRYVGVEPAKYIMENNITLEQFMLLYDWDAIYVPGVN